MDCIFCNIVEKKLPAEIAYEDEKFLAFPDIHPKAPLHLLFIPKKHIVSLDHVQTEDKELVGELLFTARKVAQTKNLKGYKIQMNVGRDGGQIIDHLHLHLLADAGIKN